MNLKEKMIVGAVCAVSAVCAVGSVLGILKIRELRQEQRAYERASEFRRCLRASKGEFYIQGHAKNSPTPGLDALGYILATALENSDIEGYFIAKAKKGEI